MELGNWTSPCLAEPRHALRAQLLSSPAQWASGHCWLLVHQGVALSCWWWDDLLAELLRNASANASVAEMRSHPW